MSYQQEGALLPLGHDILAGFPAPKNSRTPGISLATIEVHWTYARN
jgi:hypothetical protein